MNGTLFIVLMLVGGRLAAADVETWPSPSGRVVVRADMLRGDITPFVRLVFTREGKKEQMVYSEASEKWAVAWASNQVLILIYSTQKAESRFRAFEVGDRSFGEREASQIEKDIGLKAFTKKFQQKEPIQSSQRNAMAWLISVFKSRSSRG